MCKPAAERLFKVAKQPRRHIDKGRCARPAIQIFIAAANREIDITAGKINRHRAGRMGQNPDHQRPSIMGRAGKRLHVMHCPGAIIHMCEHQHRHAVIQRRRNIGSIIDMQQPVPVATLPNHSFGNVIVGWKVACFGNDNLPVRTVCQRR